MHPQLHTHTRVYMQHNSTISGNVIRLIIFKTTFRWRVDSASVKIRAIQMTFSHTSTPENRSANLASANNNNNRPIKHPPNAVAAVSPSAYMNTLDCALTSCNFVHAVAVVVVRFVVICSSALVQISEHFSRILMCSTATASPSLVAVALCALKKKEPSRERNSNVIIVQSLAYINIQILLPFTLFAVCWYTCMCVCAGSASRLIEHPSAIKCCAASSQSVQYVKKRR